MDRTPPRSESEEFLLREMLLAVRRLVAGGRTASFVVHVNPTIRRIAIVPPEGEIVNVQLDKAA